MEEEEVEIEKREAEGGWISIHFYVNMPFIYLPDHREYSLDFLPNPIDNWTP